MQSLKFVVLNGFLLDALLVPFAHDFGQRNMLVHEFDKKTKFLFLLSSFQSLYRIVQLSS